MDISVAATELGEILEVDTTQYPTNLRISHLNQSVALLSKLPPYSFLDEGFGDINVTAGSTTVDIHLLDTAVKTAAFITEGCWVNPATDNYRLQLVSLSELVGRFGDSTGYPLAVAQHGDSVYIRPIPENDIVLRLMVMFNPAYLAASGENSWLSNAPWAVIFKAAELAAVTVGQEARMPYFEKMRREHLEALALANGARFDSPRNMEEI
jgi:hypothetical protein